MCKDAQSGICYINGPTHDHQWESIKFIGTKQRIGEGYAAQWIGRRDDDRWFNVNLRATNLQGIEDKKALAKEILDYELKCCTCEGRDTHA